MSVSQLSVFVENRAGHLADTLSTLAEGRVNVLSFTIADTADYGILRIVVDESREGQGAPAGRRVRGGGASGGVCGTAG